MSASVLFDLLETWEQSNMLACLLINFLNMVHVTNKTILKA